MKTEIGNIINRKECLEKVGGKMWLKERKIRTKRQEKCRIDRENKSTVKHDYYE